MTQFPPPGFGQPMPQRPRGAGETWMDRPLNQPPHHLPHLQAPGPAGGGPAGVSNPQQGPGQWMQDGQSAPGQFPGQAPGQHLDPSQPPMPGQPPISDQQQPQPAAPELPTHPARPEFRIAAIRQHARRTIIPSLILIAAGAVIGYSFRGLREPGDWTTWAIIAGAVALVFGVAPIIAWLRHRYQVTTVRTVSRRGLFKAAKREIAHHQVTKVVMRRNWWQALFGSGNIELTAVNGRVFEMRDVPNSVTVAQALRELTGNVNRAGEAE
ncbi:MAG: PH domain-containing protein [Gulosibacter sp.]|uniref:PH domain-containing protein n=1 Tax=Gulosibacter sp. TaxID=2817531 RepID=UPI003F8E1F66